MVVELRKSRRVEVMPYRLVLWSAVAIVAVLVLLHHRPITMDAELDLADGTELTRQADADVVVVVDYEAIRQSGETFDGRDFSAAWIDLFQREVGPVSVATPEMLQGGALENARVAVLTRSVSATVSGEKLEQLRQHVLEGATVVVEWPQGEVREMFSADGQAGVRQARQITHVEGLEEPFDEQLEEMPLVTEYVGSTSPRDQATTLLAIDGAPAIYSVPFGDGQAVTVDFDLGRQITTLHQGRPNDDFTVGDPGGDRPARTADLIADDSLASAAVPYADLLGRFVVHAVIGRQAGVPALWPYAGGAAGNVMFAHEDQRLGDGGWWMMEYEQSRGGASTLFAASDAGLTGEGARRVQEHGGQIGLAWWAPHPQLADYEPLGVGAFEPFRRPIDLETQRERLDEVLPHGSVRAARALRGMWSSEWATAPAALAKLGVRADLSYQASDHRGFAFGTGRSFLMLNEQGVPLEIRQYPLVAPPGAEDGPSLEQLLEQSAEGHHQLLVVGTRPAEFADYPDVERFDRWLGLFDEIERRNHRLVTVAQHARYQRLRRGTSMESHLEPRAALPADLRDETTGPDHRATRLRVVVDAGERGMEMVVPDRVGDAQFFAAAEDAERVGDEIVVDGLDTDPAGISGIQMRRVHLERGFNVMEFYYL